jgi:hypothetical protein
MLSFTKFGFDWVTIRKNRFEDRLLLEAYQATNKYGQKGILITLLQTKKFSKVLKNDQTKQIHFNTAPLQYTFQGKFLFL